MELGVVALLTAVLGGAAAITSRLKLGTGVCVPVQHDPIRLAKQVTTLDHLSAGRFVSVSGPAG